MSKEQCGLRSPNRKFRMSSVRKHSGTNNYRARNMKALLLKLNYLLFPWYYNRVSEHFKQWTFIRSVDLLRQNYEHDKILIENNYKHNRALIEECYRLRKENASLRMNQVAAPDQISNLNRMFGTDFDNPKDN